MMNNNQLFNSKTEPIPRVRPDVNIIPVQNNGESYLYFHDMRGYVSDDFALDRSAGTILSLLNGRNSINDLKPNLANGVDTNQLLQYVRFLDENRVLHSTFFKSYAEEVEQEYEQADVHHSVTAGSSYPADPEVLKEHLDEAFEKYGSKNTKIRKITNQSSTSFVASPHCVKPDNILSTAKRSRNMRKQIKALYAPHIDTRVGMKTYVESFERVKDLEPRRVVMLATSHYSGLHADLYKNKPFIVCDKDFKMPMGTVPADREAIARLMEDAEASGLTNRDRAHRIEHSIELHLLFMQYIWDHDFSIVPIVVGGFDELFYMNGTHLSRQLDTFTGRLRDQFGDDDETLFLISGDLAHVGRKFGDEQPAATMKNEVAQFDQQFLETGRAGSTDNMLSLMKRNYDPYRICGFPPLYTFLKAFPGAKGQTVSYDRWDETERESAVTFGSILYQ